MPLLKANALGADRRRRIEADRNWSRRNSREPCIRLRYRRDWLFPAGYRSRDRLPIFQVMKKAFKRGDHVSWNSEAGRVSGTIVKVHREDVSFKGYTHHASRDDPQFEIKSDRTDHVALHKGAALRHLRRP